MLWAAVASFFISRIDTLVDARVDALSRQREECRSLRGTAAVACARLAYGHYLGWTDGERWRQRAAAVVGLDLDQGSGLFRCALRGSVDRTGYHQQSAAGDSGRLPGPRRSGCPARARAQRSAGPARAAGGIDLEEVAAQPGRDGVEKFAAAHDSLLATLAERLGR